ASRISGPYLFHSPCYYEAKINKLKVRYYEKLGTNASSGCIRLATGDAYWIYTNCPEGTPIHVITSGERDEELIEELRHIPLISKNYDPTDPEAPAKYREKFDVVPTPDPTPYPGVTPAPTPKWTVHPVLKAWGYC
ncbi:MAG: L,D-transpeptidase family protein, partial [Clostridia bacterium]|nr:L,D-transpeptidase family protein [Clostridia bacterium]